MHLSPIFFYSIIPVTCTHILTSSFFLPEHPEKHNFKINLAGWESFQIHIKNLRFWVFKKKKQTISSICSTFILPYRKKNIQPSLCFINASWDASYRILTAKYLFILFSSKLKKIETWKTGSMLKLGINVYSGIKAAEKSAHPIHWKGRHVKHKTSIATEARGQGQRQLLKGVCPSTICADRIHPVFSFFKSKWRYLFFFITAILGERRNLNF